MRHKGFTLIEAAMTTLVLITGLAAVAGTFSYSSMQTLRVQQETAAIAMAATKIEELRTVQEVSPGSFAEYLDLQPNGVVVISHPASAKYLRSWTITNALPNEVTVVIHGRITKTGTFRELARLVTRIGGRF